MNNFEWIPYVYALMWAFSLYIYWRRCGKTLNAGGFILVIWTLSALAGAWYENNLIFEHMHSITFLPYLYLFFFAFLLCIPVLRCHTEKIVAIKGNEKVIDYCIYMIALVNIVPFLENLMHFMHGVGMGQIFDLNAFNAKYEEGQSDVYFMSTLGQKCEQIADALRLFALVLFFYYFKRPSQLKNTKLFLCLMLTLANIVLMGINSGSRNTLFTYIVTSVFLYFIFSQFYTEKIRNKIKRISVIFILSVTSLFAVISVVRFAEMASSNNDAQSLEQWLAAYAGESHGIFNADTWYLGRNDLKNCDFIKYFYLYKTFGLIDKPVSKTPYPPKFHVKNVQFSTVVGTYCTNYGKAFTSISFCIVCFVFCFLLKVKKQMFVSDILFLVYYAKIPLMGFSIFCYMFDGWQLLIIPIIVGLLKVKKC